MAEIVMIRHGQTEWSANGRHTSFTDLALTATGEAQATEVGGRLVGRRFAAVFCSPRLRAQRTAALAGLRVTETCDELAEWNYGSYEGITSAEIHRHRPGWSLWKDGAPDGESPDDLAVRIDRLLTRAGAILPDGDVAFVAHGHSLRVAGARWVGLPVSAGALLHLDTATVSTLGYEHDIPVIRTWNTPPCPGVGQRSAG